MRRKNTRHESQLIALYLMPCALRWQIAHFSSLKSFFPLGFLDFFSWIVLVCSGNNDCGRIKLGRLLNVESDGEVEFEKDCPK